MDLQVPSEIGSNALPNDPIIFSFFIVRAQVSGSCGLEFALLELTHSGVRYHSSRFVSTE